MNPLGDKYWVPVNGAGTQRWVTEDQFEVALRWLQFGQPTPPEVVHPDTEDYCCTNRLCSEQLVSLGVLNETPSGYILKPQARQHLQRNRGR